jgi:hypothetical protein
MASKRMLEALESDPTLWGRAVSKVTSSLKERDGCQVYTGHTNKRNGYGAFSLWVRGADRSQVFLAHRVAAAHALGLAAPSDGIVMHSCDNPACCNPAHLSLGTQAENLADMRTKKRHAHGETSYAKLTAAQVREILSVGKSVPARVLAARFGVKPRQIHRILRGERWRHIYKEFADE